MRRINPPKLYYGYATDKYAKQLIEPWMLPYRDKLSVWQSAIINPMVILAEDTINNDLDIIKKVIFPQTSYIDEPYIFYQTHPDTKIDSIDNILLDNRPLTEHYKAVDSDADFLAMEYDTLVPYMEKDFFLNHDTYGKGIIGFGDQQGNVIRATVWHIPNETPYTYTGNYSKAVKEGIPDGVLNVDVVSKVFEQDQEVMSGAYTDVRLFEEVTRQVVAREEYHPVVLMSSDIDNLSIRSAIDDRAVDYYIIFPNQQKIYKRELDFNDNGVVDEEDFKMMKTAMGKSYETIDPEEWNELWRHFDFNNDGRVSRADMDMFLAYYPSSIWPDKSILIVRRMGGYYLTERTLIGNTPATNTFTTNTKGGFISIKNYSDDPTVVGRFPKTALDVTYDSRSDVYYYSSSVEKGVIGTKFNRLGSIVERKKFTLGEYYDWDPRGLKWKDGYLYLLIVKDGKCKILRYDTLTTYDHTFDKVIDIFCDFNDPTFLTINDEDRFVIGDGSRVYIMRNIYRRAYLKDERLLLSSHPLYEWSCYDGSGYFTYGGDYSGIISGMPSGMVSGALTFGPDLLWNVFDEYALGTGLERLPGEDNDNLLFRIMGVFRRPPGINHLGLVNAVQRDLSLRYYTPVEGYFSLRFEPDNTRLRELKIYADDVELNISRITSTDSGGYRFYDRNARLIIELEDANIKAIGEALNRANQLDIAYWTFDKDGESVHIHDRWDDFDYVARKVDEPYIDFYSLGDDEYLLDPDNGYFTADGQITEKLLRIIEKADSYSNDRWFNAVTDESFYDMTSYDGNVVVVPTKYDICIPSGMRTMSGNGWNGDIEHLEIVSDINMRGTAAAEEKWHPIVRPGFFYIEEEEYYCFHDKATFIALTGVYSVDEIRNTSSGYIDYVNGLTMYTSPTDVNDPGVNDEDYKIFDYDYVFQLDMVPDIDSPLILTEILVDFWEPSGFYADIEVTESGFISGTWVPILDIPGTEMYSGAMDSIDVDEIVGITRRDSENIFIPDLMISFNTHERFSEAYNICGTGSGIYMSGIPNREGLLLEALISGFITLDDLENKYLGRDNLLDDILEELGTMSTIGLEVTENNQTVFDIGMVIPNQYNALMVVNGLPQFVDVDYNIIGSDLVFDSAMAGFQINPGDEVVLLVWNDIITFLGNYTYPSDLYWINGFGLIGSGIVSRKLDYDKFAYNPIFNCIEVYKSGVYVLNYETESSEFMAEDIDINPFNTSFSDGYLVLEDEEREEVVEDSLKIMSLIITTRKSTLLESDTTPGVAVSLAEANRPVSKDLRIDILRSFEDDLGELEIAGRNTLDENYEIIEFARDINGTVKEDGIEIHTDRGPWTNVIMVRRKGHLIIDGVETYGADITTDITGSYPFELVVPPNIATSYVLTISLTDGDKTFTHTVLVKKSSGEIKYMSTEEGTPIKKRIKYVNATSQNSITIDEMVYSPSDVKLYQAEEYYEWMDNEFDLESEPSSIPIIDIVTTDSAIEYVLASAITGEYVLEYSKIEYNEIILNKHFTYMV